MGKNKRRKHTSDFKKRVALEAIKEDRTVNAIASEHQVHPVQVSTWKRQAIDGLERVFDGSKNIEELRRDYERREARLMEKIGQLSVELDWLKKKCGG